MKKIFLFAWAVITGLTAIAQQNIIAEAGKYLGQKKYDEADQYLNRILSKDPNNVDAIMMQGNVLIARASANAPALSLDAEKDDNIFDPTIGSIASAPRIIDQATALKVEALWLKCIALNPKRLDIYQGLCTLFSMALMKDKVIEMLPKLVKAANAADEQFAYGLEDYAQPFYQHERFDDCMEIYSAIAYLFPESGGFLGDMAAMYANHGNIQQSLEYARKAAAKSNLDFYTAYNIMAIISQGGDIDESIDKFEKGSWDNNDPRFIYYKALIEFYTGNSNWQPTMHNFKAAYKSEEEDDPRLAIAQLMDNAGFIFDTAAFHKICDTEPYEFDLLLFATRARSNFPGWYYPARRMAKLYAIKKNYSKALEILNAAAALPKTTAEDTTYRFYLAYCQFKSGKKLESETLWLGLLNSGDFFIKSAACYFLGNIYIEQGRKPEAQKMFKMVADKASESKFANFCRWKLSTIE